MGTAIRIAVALAFGLIAQSVEQQTHNLYGVGSSPTGTMARVRVGETRPSPS